MIIVNKMAIKRAFFPRNENFAKAKPAKELINSTTIVTMMHMTKEFHIEPKKSMEFNTLLKFSASIFPGVMVGGMELKAELGLVAITNIQ